MLFDQIIKTPPQHVDEYDNKFWLDKSSTEYGINKGLKGVQVCFVERPDGSHTRVIVDNGEVVYEHTSIEAIGARLDVMSLIKEV